MNGGGVIENAGDAVGLALAVIALVSAVIGWLRWVRPKIHRGKREVTAVRDAILGRDPIVDSITGEEIEPALPGMGVRMAHQEQQSRDQQLQMQILTDAVSKLAESHTRLDAIENRVKVLEDSAIERVVARAEAAHAWRAMAAAAEAQPGEAPDLS